MSTSGLKLSSPFIVIDAFCLRQFGPSAKAPAIPVAVDEVVERVNTSYQTTQLVDGYAPFCKHLFIQNWMPLQSSTVAITEHNRHHLISEYSSRTPTELPVLIRYFPRGTVQQSRADYLDVILYSRQQVDKENAAMAVHTSSSADAASVDVTPAYTTTSTDSTWSWAIVSIKPQSEAHETPMTPMTMMRNALGVSEGGSGMPLDRNEYQKSVDYWSKHAAVQ